LFNDLFNVANFTESSIFVSEISKILNFLDFPPNEERRLCTLSHLEGQYRRQALPEKLPLPFNRQQVKAD
jgi:hypothetical protein